MARKPKIIIQKDPRTRKPILTFAPGVEPPPDAPYKWPSREEMKHGVPFHRAGKKAAEQ